MIKDSFHNEELRIITNYEPKDITITVRKCKILELSEEITTNQKFHYLLI
jgi:hypothetical protein